LKTPREIFSRIVVGILVASITFGALTVSLLTSNIVFMAVFAVITALVVWELATVCPAGMCKNPWVLAESTVITLGCASIFFLLDQGGDAELWFIGYLFLVIFATDTIALGAGKLFGKPRDRPLVECSPNKTIEGFIGGILGGAAVVMLAYRYADFSDWQNIFAAMAISMTILGDLMASKLKRVIGIKDFGEKLRSNKYVGGIERFIASHGGFLDRMDSAFFVFACLFPALLFQLIARS